MQGQGRSIFFSRSTEGQYNQTNQPLLSPLLSPGYPLSFPFSRTVDEIQFQLWPSNNIDSCKIQRNKQKGIQRVLLKG